MAFEFRLPDIGEGVVEGEVVRWMVKVGDVVTEDQPMVEVMTDKATVEIPSPKAGRIASIDAPEGKMCKVGQVMVRIETQATAAPSSLAAPGQPGQPGHGGQAGHGGAPTHAGQADNEVKIPSVPRANGGSHGGPTTLVVMAGGKALATPATRKIAHELGVVLARVPATGKGGRVTTEDVRRHASGVTTDVGIARTSAAGESGAAVNSAVQTMRHEPPTHAPDRHAFSDGGPTLDLGVPGSADERIAFRGIRKKIAENMSRSRRTAAHFTYVDEADLTDLVQLRARAKKRAEERGIKLSFLPFIVKAVVAGLKKFPIVNSTLDEERGEIVLRKRYHIGIAAASAQGLIVPVLKDADRKSIFDIAKETEELSQKAREGRATRDELTGSTFTISSLGNLGGLHATPIINYPEVAILGVHKIKQTPVVREGQIVIRDIGNFSISLDHRVVDGYEGAQFLAHVIGLLADPTLMFLELV